MKRELTQRNTRCIATMTIDERRLAVVALATFEESLCEDQAELFESCEIAIRKILADSTNFDYREVCAMTLALRQANAKRLSEIFYETALEMSKGEIK